MTCCDPTSTGEFPEGTTTYHDYSFLDKDGDPITIAEAIKYKLSDGVETLIAWASISPATAPGELEVAAEFNIITNSSDRFLTFEVTHNGGKKITKTILYTLVKSVNIP